MRRNRNPKGRSPTPSALDSRRRGIWTGAEAVVPVEELDGGFDLGILGRAVFGDRR